MIMRGGRVVIGVVSDEVVMIKVVKALVVLIGSILKLLK